MEGYRHCPKYKFDRAGSYSAGGLQDLFWLAAEGGEEAALGAVAALEGGRPWKVKMALELRAREEWWRRAPWGRPSTQDGHEANLEHSWARGPGPRNLAETVVHHRGGAAAARILRALQGVRDQRETALWAAVEGRLEGGAREAGAAWAAFLRDFPPTPQMKEAVVLGLEERGRRRVLAAVRAVAPG
jgi:hypothetical protein